MKPMRMIALLLLAAFALGACGDYTIKFSPDPPAVKPGEKGKISVNLKARGKWHINEDSIVMIKFEPPEGVVMEKSELTEKDRGPENTFTAKYTVNEKTEPGNKTVKAEVFFMICSGDLCRRIIEQHEVNLRIK